MNYLIGAKTIITATTVSIYFHHFCSLLSKRNFSTTATSNSLNYHYYSSSVISTASVSVFAFAWNINTINSISTISTISKMKNISTGVVRGLRRSARLMAVEEATATSKFGNNQNKATTALFSTSNSNSNDDDNIIPNKNKNRNIKRKRRSNELTSENCNDNNTDSKDIDTTETKTTMSKSKTKQSSSSLDTSTGALPRAREIQLLQSHPNLQIIGIDEAGRGPLAGPVVAASIIFPQTTPTIQGITDSKKITKECDREYLYNQITMNSSNNNVKYAIAVVDSQTIDEINILQATLKAMSMVVNVLVDKELFVKNGGRIETQVSSNLNGCYVVLGGGGRDTDVDTSASGKSANNDSKHSTNTDENVSSYYALIDGNRTPTDLLCESEYVIKGDSREYCIGAASILAKVSRDRIMKEYDILYPQYELSRHKGKYGINMHMYCISYM